MLMPIVLSGLNTIFVVLVGWVLGQKFCELFDWRPAAAIGPLAALAIGLSYGILNPQLGLRAGIIIGVFGALGSTIALFRSSL